MAVGTRAYAEAWRMHARLLAPFLREKRKRLEDKKKREEERRLAEIEKFTNVRP